MSALNLKIRSSFPRSSWAMRSSLVRSIRSSKSSGATRNIPSRRVTAPCTGGGGDDADDPPPSPPPIPRGPSRPPPARSIGGGGPPLGAGGRWPGDRAAERPCDRDQGGCQRD